ncbi:hypothetical protein D1007_16017 [Hordeum vulgare]|uniref:Uncharacterized protein n=1 Tax=Hordeum vulgare subsp. vulgare TaxID=112509 RepID=A0A8I6X6V0_HORVV|nr:hypothetical protein D1007_16017 [Hordeum vulgare]KAI5015607.1 hypothetical protein ZWY2020_056997 [Hordeum vulgare]
MSTCSTATSPHHPDDFPLHRPACDHDVIVGFRVDRLERRLRDLERYWDEYKTSRSTTKAPRPRHRRRRWDTNIAGTPSSGIVTGAGPITPDLCPILLGRSPRKLISSLQQISSGGASASTDVTVDGGGKIRTYEEDASSVCYGDATSFVAVADMTAASSRSCSCECTIPRCPCGCSCSYSSSTLCSGSTASTSLFSLGENTAAGQMRKTEGGRWATCKVGWFAAIAVAGVAVLGTMVTAVLELGMDDGHVEFLVPT